MIFLYKKQISWQLDFYTADDKDVVFEKEIHKSLRRPIKWKALENTMMLATIFF